MALLVLDFLEVDERFLFLFLVAARFFAESFLWEDVFVDFASGFENKFAIPRPAACTKVSAPLNTCPVCLRPAASVLDTVRPGIPDFLAV